MKKLKLLLFLAVLSSATLGLTVGYSQSINGNQFQPGKLVTDTLVVNHVATIPGSGSSGSSAGAILKDTVFTVTLSPSYGSFECDSYGTLPFDVSEVVAVFGQTSITGAFSETTYNLFSSQSGSNRIRWGAEYGYLIIYQGVGDGDPWSTVDVRVLYRE